MVAIVAEGIIYLIAVLFVWDKATDFISTPNDNNVALGFSLLFLIIVSMLTEVPRLAKKLGKRSE